ncbi:hypothetical protein L2E82_30178 [Cichorium intybus]|uniref:Uncharacterized protein n=1 Tax=Cichorium intybus TaxID=13427 RepID=A0ACB9D0B2_CICIN|nr:hypothetical protein L2E82_30178 [Cichorium intybus]
MHPGSEILFDCSFVGDDFFYEEEEVRFRPLSQRKFDIHGGAHEVTAHSSYQGGLPEPGSPVLSFVVSTTGPELPEDMVTPPA